MRQLLRCLECGRLYFFDGDKKDGSRAADGNIVVDLYDMTHPNPQVNMPPLEEWRIDKVTLQKLDQATEGLEDQGPLSVLGIAVNSLF